MKIETKRLTFQGNAGFSLVEIVVAMFVLAALSLALVPALILGIKQSATNAVLAAASNLATARLDVAVAQSPTCTALANFAATSVPNVVDSHGVILHVTQTLGACPSFYPGTVAFTVAVSRLDTAATLISATTLLYVGGAN
jgi:prepilin-type N-terminal cleavage/methylation domain-containing protein